MPTPRGADRLFALAAAVLAVLFAARAAVLLAAPVTVEYGEGTTWTYAHLLRARGTYFLPIDREPWIHGTYPPLFPALQALLGGSLRAGRLVALLGTLLAAGSLAALLRGHGVEPRRALLWAAVLLGTPALHEWGAVCRVDTLALGLSLLGLALCSRHRGARGELLALVPFIAAFFAKQVALCAPAATLLSLLARGERRRAAVFAAIYGGSILALLAVLQARTHGELFRHLVTYAGFVGLAAGPAVRWTLRFAFMFPVLLPLAPYGLRALARTPAAVWVVLALLSLVLAGKPGAAANYLLEPSAAVVLAGAVAVERRLAGLAGDAARRRELTLLVLVQAVVLCGPGRPVEALDLLRGAREGERVVAALAAVPGPVLAEDLGLVLAAGKEPMLEPFQLGLMARAGKLDPEPVLAEVRAGRFGAVLVGWRLAAFPGIEGALREGYVRGPDTGGLAWWQPRPRPTPTPTPRAR